MQYGGYDSDAVRFAVALIATRPTDRFADELREPEDLRELAARYGVVPAHGPPRGTDLEAVRDVRDALASVFVATTADDAGRIVNDVLRRSRSTLQVTTHDGTWHHHYVPADTSWANTCAAVAGGALAHVLIRGGLDRLGECAADDCETYFVDASRNLSRRFCCERCATRAAVKAYRARRSRNERT
jgi:predicted RNA-binding Zn ribbon-like protein